MWNIPSLGRSVQIGGWGKLWLMQMRLHSFGSKETIRGSLLLIWASALISCHRRRCSCLSLSLEKSKLWDIYLSIMQICVYMERGVLI